MEKIPKKIHYCWFGGNPLPEDARKCIESWKTYCPGYEIRQWDETNYRLDEKCAYVRQACEKKKWAFVSDYARFDILNEFGGIYFDTDVELVAPIDDILQKGAFMGCEPGREAEQTVHVATGLGLALPEKHPICSMMLEQYAKDLFILPSGRQNPKNVVHRVSEILAEQGFTGNNQIQTVMGITIYPTDYFCPLNYFTGERNLTSNTRSIHHYSATWKNTNDKRIKELTDGICNRVGTKLGKPIAKVVTVPVWAAGKIQEHGFWGFGKYCVIRVWEVVTHRG